MQVLIHIGLNKCASTYIQHSLAHMRHQLAECGVWYPMTSGAAGHYGLSCYYGFGPDVDRLETKSVADMVHSAKENACQRLILSSEYLSLYRPAAAAHLIRDLANVGCDATFVLFSRDLAPWIRSLFNQYIRTVEDGRHMRCIDDFVDQVLANRAIDVAARYKMWADLIQPCKLQHFKLGGESDAAAVLTPFSEFSGTNLVPPQNAIRNDSVSTNALFRIGQLRSRFRTPSEEAELAQLLAGAPCPIPAPSGYMQISPDRAARLQSEIGDSLKALSFSQLRSVSNGLISAATAA